MVFLVIKHIYFSLKPIHNLKPKGRYWYIDIILVIISAFIFVGCSPHKISKQGPQISINQLPVKYNANFIEVLAIGQKHPSNMEGPFLTQNLFQRGAWHRISVFSTGDLSNFYLDTGITPTGIKKVVLYDQKSLDGWTILEKSTLPDRYIGPIYPFKKKATVYIQTITPVPMKVQIQLSKEKKVSIWQDIIPFASAFAAILVILLLQMTYFFIATKDRIYLYLTGVLLGHAGYFIYYTGIVRLFPGNNSPFAYLFYPAIIYFVFLNLAFSKLFHLKQRSPGDRKVLQYFNYGHFLLAAAYTIFSFEYEVTTIYFIISALNSVALLVISISTIRKSSRFEQILCVMFIVMQIHSVFLFIYRSGIENLLPIGPSMDMTVYNFGEGASLFVFYIFVVGMFLGSISARYGKTYNQLEIMEDEFKDLPENVKEERKRIASGSPGQQVQFSPEEIEKIKHQLSHLLNSEKIYRKPDLDLTELAQMLNIKPWKLSLFLNEYLKTNFRDLIASHRIKEVKKALLSEDDKNILRIAMDAGFESKSAFYRVFSRQFGMTPLEYRKKMKM